MASRPEVELAPLPRADGSATFSHNGFKILSSINGPIETVKKDEAAFESLIDVVVRPAAGVGGTRERHLESVISSTLHRIIPVKNYPRCVIQIVLQILETPENLYENTKTTQAQINIAAIPALLHSAVLGLMTAAIPLTCLATATIIAVPNDTPADTPKFLIDPSAVEISRARSVHALGYTSKDELLLVESEGRFSPSELKAVLAEGERACCQARRDEMDLDTAMEDSEPEIVDMKHFMRSVMTAKVKEDLFWKTSA